MAAWLSPTANPFRTQVVLAVDDEPDILESLQALLESSLDVSVLTAPSGPDALRILEGRAVDLIITDYRMPGMTGLEFLSAARKVAPEAARILITAYPDLDIALQSINQEGVENFVVKPFDPETVVENVFNVLFTRRSEEMRSRSFARAIELLRREAHRES